MLYFVTLYNASGLIVNRFSGFFSSENAAAFAQELQADHPGHSAIVWTKTEAV